MPILLNTPMWVAFWMTILWVLMDLSYFLLIPKKDGIIPQLRKFALPGFAALYSIIVLIITLIALCCCKKTATKSKLLNFRGMLVFYILTPLTCLCLFLCQKIEMTSLKKLVSAEPTSEEMNKLLEEMKKEYIPRFFVMLAHLGCAVCFMGTVFIASKQKSNDCSDPFAIEGENNSAERSENCLNTGRRNSKRNSSRNSTRTNYGTV